SNTRPEWTYADFAALCAGATVVPVYQTSSPEECRHVLEHSMSRVVLCEDAEQVSKVEQVRDHCQMLEHVAIFEGEAEGALTLEALRDRGRDTAEEQLEDRLGAVGPDDVATIIYTSGTTGPPKGCVLTHGNYRSHLDQLGATIDVGERALFFVFLPLAHALTRITQMWGIDAGATLAYWERDVQKIVPNLGEVEPTHFASVPRIFEKVHATATGRAEDAGAVKGKIFEWATRVGRKAAETEHAGATPGPGLRLRRAIADKLVLSKIRTIFGDNLELAFTGAAPIAPEILRFFAGAGVTILEGYGMTETSAAATLNTPSEVSWGTVGKPLPASEVRLADDGEVLMRGPHIFQGYYQDEQETAETLVDGWLHSGDLGSFTEDGFLQITGRKKDLIVTSSGKNIAPSNIEESIKQSRWVSQAVVYGDRRSYLTAILTLDPQEAPKLAEQLEVDPDPASMAGDDRVHGEVGKAVDAANQKVARIEQVKRFAILDHDLSQSEGELTPTLKVKRNVVYERYADVFEGLYAD
ncbi:MAG: long-chain fatty acid--CoA ligase, partial [Actinomycetota bacterium]|nr:long-chain fatty acid--CoA ligase [Actinomycetota bacterium]